MISVNLSFLTVPTLKSYWCQIKTLEQLCVVFIHHLRPDLHLIYKEPNVSYYLTQQIIFILNKRNINLNKFVFTSSSIVACTCDREIKFKTSQCPAK